MGTKGDRSRTSQPRGQAAWGPEQGVLEQVTPPSGASVSFLIVKLKTLISKCM